MLRWTLISILDVNVKPYEKIQKLFLKKSFREYDSGKSKLCLKTTILASWLSDRTGSLMGWGDQPSRECSCKWPQERKVGGSRKSERPGQLREKRAEKPVSQNGPHNTCGGVGARLVRPRSQACSFFLFFFLVLPVYCYQPISLHPHAHMLSHVTPWTQPTRLLCPWTFPGKNTGVGCHFLLHQACSLKPGAPLWLLTLHPSCLTKVYTVRGTAQVTSLHLRQNSSLLI